MGSKVPGGMTVKGGSMGSSGVNVQFANPQGAAQETSATTSARIQAEQSAKLAENQKLLQSMSSLGKPLDEVDLNDAVKVFGGDFDTAKKFMDLKKSFADSKPDTATRKVEIIVPILDNLFTRILPKIPTAEGAAGRAYGYVNKAQQMAGYNPYLTTYMNSIKLIRPIMVKAMGDSGNLSEAEQKTAMMLAEQAATGTTTERRMAIDQLKMILTTAAGKQWGQLVNRGKKETMKDLSTDELLDFIKGGVKR
jgi:hypothetical protein